eukprot:TRINITY_DN31592_c0_g1_i1.p1 TRINITY_DN31592_c0_g1~~TRINITY_DN31592_c0_g1_i1.p1  ORF type:complete len:111 (+),score=28.30 TRINITY_DN31592_c0_g1_i1:278-610(+)
MFLEGLPLLPPGELVHGLQHSCIPSQVASVVDDGFFSKIQAHHLGMPLKSVITEMSDDASILFAEGDDLKTFPDHMCMPLKFADKPMSDDGFSLQKAIANAPLLALVEEA